MTHLRWFWGIWSYLSTQLLTSYCKLEYFWSRLVGTLHRPGVSNIRRRHLSQDSCFSLVSAKNPELQWFLIAPEGAMTLTNLKISLWEHGSYQSSGFLRWKVKKKNHIVIGVSSLCMLLNLWYYTVTTCTAWSSHPHNEPSEVVWEFSCLLDSLFTAADTWLSLPKQEYNWNYNIIGVFSKFQKKMHILLNSHRV